MVKGTSPVDMKKILEGRAVIDQDDLRDAPIEHKMYMLMLEGEYSTDELVYILCPDEVDYNKKRKKDIPNKHGTNLVKKAVCQVNKWILNRNEVVNSVKDKFGHCRYTSIQKIKDFNYTEEHQNAVKDNIESIQNRKKKIIKTPTKVKNKAKQETNRIIRLAAIERRRRKRGGAGDGIA